jgi:hypothetical protein
MTLDAGTIIGGTAAFIALVTLISQVLVAQRTARITTVELLFQEIQMVRKELAECRELCRLCEAKSELLQKRLTALYEMSKDAHS